MFASLISDLTNWEYWIHSPWLLAVLAFQVWMFVDAIRREEWIWAAFIFLGFGLSAFLYYFFVYRAAPSATRGFELPGAQKRKRIKELKAQIHHLDKPHHHLELGDIYFQQGKLKEAEESYRASLERDGQDIDARAHLGQCLLRQKRAAEARPLLEGVCAENPKHDYGYSLMALAETLTALGEKFTALQIWQRVLENNSYPRAKVQLAELYLERNETNLARQELNEIIADDAHAPAYQRKRDRIWVRRAKALSRKVRS
jgi:tetratricopeptide (TPR) repeat protein